MSNIVIIGSGPAGVSAALYTARAGVDTTVLTRGPGALDRAELIQNYYGFAAPISGAELERQGIEGAKAVGVKFVTTEAVGLTYTDKLTVETLDGDYPADAVVLATGASRATPRIPGLAGLEVISFMAFRPAPFCFVDEIDAALDDANVERYSRMIADYKKKTQFIVISHRKKTMEFADTLQGVTMAEKGVSSLITVKMKDYVE